MSNKLWTVLKGDEDIPRIIEDKKNVETCLWNNNWGNETSINCKLGDYKEAYIWQTIR